MKQSGRERKPFDRAPSEGREREDHCQADNKGSRDGLKCDGTNKPVSGQVEWATMIALPFMSRARRLHNSMTREDESLICIQTEHGILASTVTSPIYLRLARSTKTNPTSSAAEGGLSQRKAKNSKVRQKPTFGVVVM